MGGIDSYGIEEGDNSIAYGGFGESASIGPADRSDAVRDVCLLCIPVLWIHQHITHVRLTTIEEGRERKNYEQGSNCQAVVPLRSQHHGITQEKRTLEARRGIGAPRWKIWAQLLLGSFGYARFILPEVLLLRYNVWALLRRRPELD
jgi:hypothetical protein